MLGTFDARWVWRLFELNLSRDRLVADGPWLYTAAEGCLPVVRISRLVSDEFIIAARRTERLTDHATSARHARTVRPMRPRAPPTAMKTVPSGMLDVCMYGAFAVGGTVTTGIFVTGA